VRDGGAKAAVHGGEAKPKIFLLTRERELQNFLENLLVADLKRLLDSYVRVESREPGMFVASAGQIPQRSHIDEAGEEPGNLRERRKRKILDDFTILLKLRLSSHPAVCSADRTF
jgi:hypothetical protein